MKNGRVFEEQVRNVARARWSLPLGEGGSDYVNRQEIDCVARTEDIVHLVMCTVSHKIEKIRSDVTKLIKAHDYLTCNELATVQCRIVTEREPTPDQRQYARSHKIKIESLGEFSRALIDVPNYFSRRAEYRFGSARNLFKDNSERIPDDEYVELTLREVGSHKTYSVKSIANLLEEGKVIVLTADFGAGKSLTVREVFLHLCRRYENPDTAGKTPVPLAINLHEHRRTDHYSDVLSQHARYIAYPTENHLVRVWNAGMSIVLLDGFDELPALQLRDDSPKSRATSRREATKLVRNFVASSRDRGGVLLAGRGQYFDSDKEMRDCCSLQSSDLVLRVEPFSDEQVAEYLRRKNVSWTPPVWLPRNPLLIGYLVASGLLETFADRCGETDQVEGWDSLIALIGKREADGIQNMFDGESIVKLMRRLASRSRIRSEGVSTVDSHDINEAYRDVFDDSPIDNEYAVGFLQRLPGLTRGNQSESGTLEHGAPNGSRSFIDSFMADALRGADLVQFIENPYDPFLVNRSGLPEVYQRVRQPLSRFGCEFAAFETQRRQLEGKLMLVAADRALTHYRDATLALDILIAAGLRTDIAGLDCCGLTIADAHADELDWDELALANLTLRECIVRTLSLPADAPTSIRLDQCLIDTVKGATNKDGLPNWVLGCYIEQFDSTGNASALMNLNASLPVRIALTILQKLYKQRGSGRTEGAFSRGIELNARRIVPDVLEALRSAGLIERAAGVSRPTWLAVMGNRPRAEGLIAAAGRGDDPLLASLNAIR